MRIFKRGSVSPVTVANYLLDKDLRAGAHAMDPLKLIYMVYQCHGRYLGEYNVPLVNELVEAWRLGTIFPSIYKKTERYGSQPIPKLLDDPSGDQLTDRQKRVADEVYDDYCDFDSVELMLREIKRGSPWHDVYVIRSKKFFPIPNGLIKAHYKEWHNARYA
ncbi:MAG: DUF4065 domain-containing protein [Proteobacteria bacterium]|nr:DUF4065 domain-containing protein [Pseudomonadota bacterium]